MFLKLFKCSILQAIVTLVIASISTQASAGSSSGGGSPPAPVALIALSPTEQAVYPYDVPELVLVRRQIAQDLAAGNVSDFHSGVFSRGKAAVCAVYNNYDMLQVAAEAASETGAEISMGNNCDDIITRYSVDDRGVPVLPYYACNAHDDNDEPTSAFIRKNLRTGLLEAVLEMKRPQTTDIKETINVELETSGSQLVYQGTTGSGERIRVSIDLVSVIGGVSDALLRFGTIRDPQYQAPVNCYEFQH